MNSVCRGTRTAQSKDRREVFRSRNGGTSRGHVAFSTPEHLVQTVRRGLRHIQYRSHLIDGCLTETGLTISPA